jgi:hypothetical protein
MIANACINKPKAIHFAAPPRPVFLAGSAIARHEARPAGVASTEAPGPTAELPECAHAHAENGSRNQMFLHQASLHPNQSRISPISAEPRQRRKIIASADRPWIRWGVAT